MKRLLKPLPLVALVLGTLPAMLPTTAAYAEEGEVQKPKPVYPPIGKTEMQTTAFDLALRADTQTLAHLSPKGNTAFDFVPAAREPERAGDGYVHIGDIHIRLKTAGSDWQDFSSAHARKQIAALAGGNGVLAAADITASMGAGIPLRVERRWVNEAGVLAMRFTLVNTSSAPVEIGGLGMPMVFDNIILDRDLDQAHAEASFVDPYIGRDAGYLQVTRLNGQGPALLVLPEKGTPLEAYRPIIEARAAKDGDIFTDKSQRSQVSEGFYDWTVASKGFAEKEWAKAGQQWNEPTSITLAPGESRTIGLRFVTAPDIRKIEDTLVANKRPVAVGIPGYVVPTDQTASLFLKTPSKVAKIESFPAGALTATSEKSGTGWARYRVKASGWGQARLTVTYADGQKQTVSYYITKPLDQVMADIGHFTTTNQWFEGKNDPFHRSPAILSYDREDNKILTQDGRVWVAGMSDEGGAGSWVAAMMKQLDNPSPEEVAKLERLVNETVLGTLQVKDGPQAGAVKKSIFYYDPVEFPNYYDPKINWKNWTAWSKKDSDDLGRSYNYPHVAIGHWVLYRLARDSQGLVKQHDWKFYLDWAYRTSVAMMRDAPYYAQFGQMEGDVFLDILKDLKREGLTAEATEMEGLMKGRADHWRTLKFPFGSEMAWDSTGQPEVYAWMRYFGYQPQADETREVILAYDPTIPSWGYNGNARRYWDFLYGGKVSRIERQIHHYGSALNAVPLFDAYRQNPTDLHLLRVAYGGMMGGITNIDQQGFGSAAFHSWPDMMKWDAITGDYGMGFYGHAITSATYMVDDAQFGWLGFGGDLTAKGTRVHVEPKDGARRRLFIAPAGLWVTLEAGRIKSADYDARTGKVVLTLDPATAETPAARLLFETTTAGGKPYTADTGTADRGGYAIPLGTGATTVTLSPR
ncbi:MULTISPECIES: DUF5695 domain-containing protein [Novosphingobium]|uniref:DUF5695 domain-containing protein n=1 Tax=unclassified Novosphingobium TaxID=2644732 RepID=UPI00104DC426|nr:MULTISPECIES: DUF5695 domain-containing protein [unclassified Novosphingobium]MPS68668.1 hypothetical protein [Novosphingobium sp.]TCM25105.1 hypothetical protein EDF59_14611 [Novosphingobium sp. ST904]